MREIRRTPWAWALASLVVLLQACGGGGGGGAGGDGGAGALGITFTPATSTVTAFQGEPQTFKVIAALNQDVSGTVQVGIVDTTGVIGTDVTIAALDPRRYEATLKTSATLAPGTYNGNLELRLCRDVPTTCAQPVTGSPWRVPYRITIQSGTNLTGLTPLPGAGEWTTYQGSPSHLGFVAVAAPLDPAAFTRRWSRVLRTDGSSISSVTVAAGRVFVSTGQSQSALIPRVLLALAEFDGQTLWQQDFGTEPVINPPAVAGGSVYLALTGSIITPRLLAFDAASGAERARRDIGAQFDRYLAPTVRDGFVCTPSGRFGGVGCYDATDLSLKWQLDITSSLSSIATTITPAVDDTTVYAFIDDRLRVFNRADGVQFRAIADPQPAAGNPWSGRNAPVLAGGGKVLVSAFGSAAELIRGGRLMRLDATAGTVDWQVVDRFSSNPVPVGDTVLVVNRAALEARSAATGALQWSWPIPSLTSDGASPAVPLIAIGQHAFVSVGGQTFAVDLRTRAEVWRYPLSGELAVSANGVLYIANEQGTLAAINLR